MECTGSIFTHHRKDQRTVKEKSIYMKVRTGMYFRSPVAKVIGSGSLPKNLPDLWTLRVLDFAEHQSSLFL